MMDAYRAIGIFDGFEEPKNAAEVIEAARFIRDKGPRGVLCGNGTQKAIDLANRADAGEFDYLLEEG